jgi:hypothetical protein
MCRVLVDPFDGPQADKHYVRFQVPTFNISDPPHEDSEVGAKVFGMKASIH